MTSRQVDSLLDERARIIAQRTATEAHLWRAEHLLHQCGRLLRQLIADSPHNNAARATLLDELHEFLAESRPHPGSAVEEVPGASGKDALPSSTATRVGEWGGD